MVLILKSGVKEILNLYDKQLSTHKHTHECIHSRKK